MHLALLSKVDALRSALRFLQSGYKAKASSGCDGGAVSGCSIDLQGECHCIAQGLDQVQPFDMDLTLWVLFLASSITGSAGCDKLPAMFSLRVV